MRKIILILFLIMSGLMLKAQPAGYTPVTDLAKFKDQFAAIAKKTETIKSDFTQEKNLSMLSEKIVSTGKFWFKKTNLLRMEYTKPYPYLMILNSDKVYVKDGKKESTLSTRSNKVFQQINKVTVDCVQGNVLNNPDFNTKVFENKGTYLVELSPISKGLKDFFKAISITVDKKDYSVNSIEMHENSGDNTILRFTNKETNAPLADALFTIK
jgi:outer membrane lipoprotein-sorting protein